MKIKKIVLLPLQCLRAFWLLISPRLSVSRFFSSSVSCELVPVSIAYKQLKK
jgi:hypothetical protein